VGKLSNTLHFLVEPTDLIVINLAPDSNHVDIHAIVNVTMMTVLLARNSLKNHVDVVRRS